MKGAKQKRRYVFAHISRRLFGKKSETLMSASAGGGRGRRRERAGTHTHVLARSLARARTVHTRTHVRVRALAHARARTHARTSASPSAPQTHGRGPNAAAVYKAGEAPRRHGASSVDAHPHVCACARARVRKWPLPLLVGRELGVEEGHEGLRDALLVLRPHLVDALRQVGDVAGPARAGGQKGRRHARTHTHARARARERMWCWLSGRRSRECARVRARSVPPGARGCARLRTRARARTCR